MPTRDDDTTEPDGGAKSLAVRTAFAVSVGASLGGLGALYSLDMSTRSQRMLVVTVVLAEFAAAAAACLALRDIGWFSRRFPAPMSERAFAAGAIVVSVTTVLLIAMYAFISAYQNGTSI